MEQTQEKKEISKFDYFYQSEANQFAYYRIPKDLVINKEFSELSIPAKFLYALFLDRATLSFKNGFLDERGRVFIIYKVEALMDDSGLSNKSVAKFSNELEEYGLIKRKRLGLGQPNRIYVMNFRNRK